jgi:outer membrane protein TolC
MRNEIKTCIQFLFQLFFFLVVYPINIPAQQNHLLNEYIRLGIQNNLALQQKELNLEKSLKALREANGLFYPSFGLEAQYMLAKGGRSVELPVGDMLNGVYSSLNSILQDMGQPAPFPQIPNEKIEFLPNNYHDTRIRVIMPLVNSEIYYNRKIKKEMITSTQAEINVFKRELIKEIKVAYYRYLQSVKVLEAYKSALVLVNEAKRVNLKLMENQLSGPEKLYRIEAEHSQVKAQLIKAENDRNIAVSYFNFLLNQPLQNQVEIDSMLIIEQVQFEDNFPGNDAGKREEIGQLNSAIRSTDYYFRMNRSRHLPVISNITDIGYQGYSYRFASDQQYIMSTFNLSWPLFAGFQYRNKTAQARIESENLEKRLTETEQQIELQCRVAVGNLRSSAISAAANKSALLSSKEYHKVVSRQYATGQKSLLDLLDAQNQLTSAQISCDVSHFETLIRLAELERVEASVNIDEYNND